MHVDTLDLERVVILRSICAIQQNLAVGVVCTGSMHIGTFDLGNVKVI